MRKFINLITNRLTIIGIILLLQVGVLWWFVYEFAASWYYLHLTSVVLGILISLYIITTDENPMFKLVWIVFLIALPLFGVMFYLYSRTERLSISSSSSMRDAQKQREEKMKKIESVYNVDYLKHQRYLTRLNFPSFKNTRSMFLSGGEEKQQELIRELRQAKHRSEEHTSELQS